MKSKKPTEEQWEEEARKHGHRPGYYNDSECGGCAKLRAADPALAKVGLEYANRERRYNAWIWEAE